MIRILSLDSREGVAREMQAFGVDKYGIRIMADKGIMRLIKLESIPGIAANILKQEMLSLGGEVAVSRGSITGARKATDCLIMGTLTHLNNLVSKLKGQPFGLGEIGKGIKNALDSYIRKDFSVPCRRYRLNLGRRTLLMGIVNLTPDSFSGDGLYNRNHPPSHKASADARRSFNEGGQNYIINYVEQLVKDGADIIDIGGESSRPGARPVSIKEEIRRTVPIIKSIAKKVNIPVSIDTYKPEVAKAALDAGASIVNDIMGVNLDHKMASVVRQYKAAIVLMHIKGRPRIMQKNPQYKNLLSEILSSLEKAITRAQGYGISKDKIIIDPGIGFGKTLEHNLEILKNLKEFKVLGCPILVGSSRKSFIGRILNLEPQHRIMGTAASISLAIANGAHIVRVRDVKEMRQVAQISDAILN